MTSKTVSAGTLLFRDDLVLLVHPSGNYNARAPWGIPKGLIDDGETLEEAARRETFEETGMVAGPLIPLGSVQYKKYKKTVHCFAGPAVGTPRTASWEVDRAEFVPLETARQIMHPDQLPFLDRLFPASIQDRPLTLPAVSCSFVAGRGRPPKDPNDRKCATCGATRADHGR